MEFKAWPKIPRWNREITITEKIDGTNACVIVTEDGEVGAQSRKRIITPGNDNFGFAGWVKQHETELLELGPGYHYGEWYGLGIQRGYGLTERRFALFKGPDDPPGCCGVVPVLHNQANMNFIDDSLDDILFELKYKGSKAVPGFMKPEGIVIYHHAARQSFKITLENDDATPSG